MSLNRLWAVIVFFLGLVPAVSQAGIIGTCTFLGTAPNSLTACVFGTPFPSNDPVPAAGPPSLNTGLIAETFVDETLPVDKGFFPLPIPPGITEYFVTHTVTNTTDVVWTDLHLVLGTGSGGTFAPSSGVADFDVPDGPSPFGADLFSIATVVSAGELMFSGGTVPIGATVMLAYALDVNDLGFTMRTFPTFEAAGLPEPPTLTLLLACLVALVMIHGLGRVRRSGN